MTDNFIIKVTLPLPDEDSRLHPIVDNRFDVVAAKHWLNEREGRAIIEQLKQVIKQLDYNFYLAGWILVNI